MVCLSGTFFSRDCPSFIIELSEFQQEIVLIIWKGFEKQIEKIVIAKTKSSGLYRYENEVQS
jgi:hypothetical protein